MRSLVATTEPPRLPADCLEQIILNLEYDVRSLHSCLLVDRMWCATVVSSLWRRPFALVRSESSARLVERYLLFLSQDARSRLKRAGVCVPAPIDERRCATFNYPVYLRELDLAAVTRAARGWYRGSALNGENVLWERIPLLSPDPMDCCTTDDDMTIDVDDGYTISLLVQELWAMIMTKCRRLDSLGLVATTASPNRTRIRHNSGTTYPPPNCLTCLRSLNCMEVDKEAFDAVKRTCTQLQRLEFRGTLRFDMAMFIVEQSNLQHVALDGCDTGMPDVLQAIRCQASSLTHVEFNRCRNFRPINMEAAVVWETLETLVFNRCTYSGTPLGNSTFPTLKKLKILDSELPSDFPKILASGARSLKTICLRVCGRRGPHQAFLRTVADTCPNLVSIEVSLEPLDRQDLFYLLYKSANRLQHLVIGGLKSDVSFLPKMGTHLPTSLRTLYIKANWDVNATVLESFFNNCRASLECLIVPTCAGISLNHLKVVAQYAHAKKSLKTFYLRHMNRRGRYELSMGALVKLWNAGVDCLTDGTLDCFFRFEDEEEIVTFA